MNCKRTEQLCGPAAVVPRPLMWRQREPHCAGAMKTLIWSSADDYSSANRIAARTFFDPRHRALPARQCHLFINNFLFFFPVVRDATTTTTTTHTHFCCYYARGSRWPFRWIFFMFLFWLYLDEIYFLCKHSHTLNSSSTVLLFFHHTTQNWGRPEDNTRGAHTHTFVTLTFSHFFVSFFFFCIIQNQYGKNLLNSLAADAATHKETIDFIPRRCYFGTKIKCADWLTEKKNNSTMLGTLNNLLFVSWRHLKNNIVV